MSARASLRRYSLTREQWEALSETGRDHVRLWNRPPLPEVITARSVHAELLDESARMRRDGYRPLTPFAARIGRIRIARDVRSDSRWTRLP